MKAAAVAALAAAAAAGGCGSSGHAETACGRVTVHAGDRVGRAPAPLLQRALGRALARGSAHVRLVVDLKRTVPPAVDVSDSEIPPERLRDLADNPFCLVLEGDVSGEDYDLEGTLEAAGDKHDVALRAARGRVYFRAGDAWHSLGPKHGFFSGETAGGLIPEAFCVRGESEGCERVDVRPAIRKGIFARLVRGSVTDAGDDWVVTGPPDPDRLALLTASPPEHFDPYERHGRVLAAVGKHDGLLHAVDVRYATPGGRVHVAVELSHWGTDASVDAPKATRATQSTYERLYIDFYALLILYY